jgi:4-amino-4-deoxy-L-arabinose transferase-like glycosyltransferase
VTTHPSLSIVIPVRDEAANLPLLLDELHGVLDALDRPAEVIVVDDGSEDGSADVVREHARRDARLRLLRLARHAGLSAAFQAGFRAARGDVVVTLDGDLQNDPRDIPALLAALEDADAVTGWRSVRQDAWSRRAASTVANRIRDAVTGDRVRDSACSLRAIRRRCLDDLPAFDGMHRFLPTLLRAAGHRVVEIPVNHRPRRFGRSHFGIGNRALVTAQDLLALRWLLSRRLGYETLDERRPAAATAPRATTSADPRDAFALCAARRLAAFWLAAMALVVGGALLLEPGIARELAPGTTDVTLFPTRPDGAVLAVGLGWDAPPGREAWVVLEGAHPRSETDAMSWRRRVHGGWNHLVWADLTALPAGEPVRLRLEPASAAPWRIAEPRVDAGYRLHHLTPFRGLLGALGLVIVLAPARVVARSRRAPRPNAGRWWLAVAAIAGIALWLRLHTLALQSLWFDEVLTAIGARDLAWVIHTPQIFGHPPAHYLAAWLVGGSAATEWWLRLPSIVAGTATIAALACLGRALLGPATGLAAALALSLSPFHVEISQLARPYALFLLLTVLSLTALLQALERQRARDWLWFSALATLNLYTHYLAWQVLALEAAMVAVLLPRPWSRRALPAVASFAGAGVLMVPWAPILTRLGSAQLGRGDVSAASFRELLTTVFVPQFLGPGLGTLVGLGLIGCAVVGLRRRPPIALGTLLWLALPPFVLWLAQPAHFIAGRHLAFTLPIVMLLLGHGVVTVAEVTGRAARRLGAVHHALPRLGAAAAAAAVVVAWSAPTAEALRHYYQARQGIDWRFVATVLDEAVGADDRVVATVGALYPLRHYWSVRVEDLAAAGYPGTPPRGGARWWVVAHAGWDRPPQLGGWLDTHAVKVGAIPASWSVPGLELYRLRGGR